MTDLQPHDVAALGRVVLATANANKAAEIKAILWDWELIPRPSSVPDVDETSDTLVGNARLKAQALAITAGLAALADDTGLEVPALDGAPGVHSARYAGPNAIDDENVEKLLTEMSHLEGAQRAARFRTVALLLLPDGREVIGEGVLDGHITTARRGENGFGYDVVFVPLHSPGMITFGQMSADEKNKMSHRSKAFLALRDEVAKLEKG